MLICERASEYFQCVRKLLAHFTKEEQIVLFHIRNMLVHGWVNAEHMDQINIKFFDGSRVVVEQLDREKYWNLKREFFGNFYSGTVNLDHILAPLKERFKTDSTYWAVLASVLSPDFTKMVEQGIATDLGLK